MKVLVVEDNECNLKLYKNLLSLKGYETYGAYTAEDGIRIAEKEQPSLILMDIVLPGMNGIEAARILKAGHSTGHIPIVAVTGSDGKNIKGEFDYFMSKPIEINEFFRIVDETASKNWANENREF